MDGPGSGDAGVPAYSYFDLDVNYQVTAQIQLTGGLTNLFNKLPPRVAGSIAPDRCGDLRCDGQGVLCGCQGEHRLTACQRAATLGGTGSTRYQSTAPAGGLLYWGEIATKSSLSCGTKSSDLPPGADGMRAISR